MKKILAALMVGGALAAATTAATAAEHISFSIAVPGIVVNVGQPALVSVPFYGVVAPYAYEYGAPVYYRPAPAVPVMRAHYVDRRHLPVDRYHW